LGPDTLHQGLCLIDEWHVIRGPRVHAHRSDSAAEQRRYLRLRERLF